MRLQRRLQLRQQLERIAAQADVDDPGTDALFQDSPQEDAVARVGRVDEGLQEMVPANETRPRMMRVHSLQRAVGDSGVAARQNRRSPLIEAALAPALVGAARKPV